jgi:hypothetical protein
MELEVGELELEAETRRKDLSLDRLTLIRWQR